MKFYENLENHYDRMTRFNERIDREKSLLEKWVEKYKFQSALDVACGTGLHSILLAQMGIKTTGVDISETMLKQARLHGKEFKGEVTWILSSMEELKSNLREKYDAIFCLGNSIPHILDVPSLGKTFKNFYELLNAGGLLVIQLLNYKKIYDYKNRIVGIHREKDTEYIRFYDFYPALTFNILIVTWKGNKSKYKLQSTGLYPYRKEELDMFLQKEGFRQFEYYGDMTFSPFDENNSSNLVLVARKISP
ncbi:MAG: methyltransferase domain-containing protein [Candidatus Eremiobacterota bacterium]